MFANPRWFNAQSAKALPDPQTRRGWAFYAFCVAGILGPASLLVARGLVFPEALIWLAVSGFAFWMEIRGLRKELGEQEALRNMYVIDENNAVAVDTGQYELELKSPAGEPG